MTENENKNQEISKTIPNFFADRRKMMILVGIGVAVIILMIFFGVDGDTVATVVGIFFWAGFVIIAKAANKKKQQPIFSAIFSQPGKSDINKVSDSTSSAPAKSQPAAFSGGDKARAIAAIVGVVLILLVGIMFYIAK